jgi:hypothetical protein
VIDIHSAFSQHLLQLTVTDAVFAVPAYGPQNDVTLKMPAFEWVHVQLHQQKGDDKFITTDYLQQCLKIDHTEETTGVVGKAERLTWHKAWTMVSTGFQFPIRELLK